MADDETQIETAADEAPVDPGAAGTAAPEAAEATPPAQEDAVEESTSADAPAEPEAVAEAEAAAPAAETAAPEAAEATPPAPEDAVEEPSASADAPVEPEAVVEAEPAVVETATPAAEEAVAEDAGTEDAPAQESAADVSAAPASDASAAPPRVKRKRKRLPRVLRHKHSKPVRERSETRATIVRTPKPETTPGRRQERRGVVVSDKGDKTIVVKVETSQAHPKYKKVVRRSRRLHAHDEENTAGVGDVVRIVESRPLSKTKHWRLAEIVQKAK